jgi:hypothetical protein
MAWENRSNDKRYLYRSHRDADGRVQKEYLGTGAQAEEAHLKWEAEKRIDKAEKLALQSAKKEADNIDKLFSRINKIAIKLAEDLLSQSGWHNPNSRGLRRRRKK